VRATDRFTPRSYQALIARKSYPRLRIDYAPVGRSWAVLSGAVGQTMIYEKIMFSCGGAVINSFTMTYPIAQRRFYDPLIEPIEDTDFAVPSLEYLNCQALTLKSRGEQPLSSRRC
jgi:hypothetical protein